MKGGGKQLLSLQSEENTDTEVVQTNLIDNEIWDLRREVSELKVLIQKLINSSKN